MRIKLFFLGIALLFLAGPRSYAAGESCRTYPGQPYDVSFVWMANVAQAVPDSQKNFFDYGVIFEDANSGNAACQDWAAIALYKKVRATLEKPYYKDNDKFGNAWIGPYQGWLDGSQVTLIYATALRLGAAGKLTKPLADLLDQIPYVANIERTCGFATNRFAQTGVWKAGNSCMDDWALAASGWGWTAAWRDARNKPYSSYVAAVNQTAAAMMSAFDIEESVCLHRPGDPMPAVPPAKGPCTATVADLTAGTAVALGLHGGDEPAYGFGLLSSIASADVALTFSGMPPTYSTPLKTIAQALFKNADLHTVSGGSAFKQDCYRFDIQNGSMVRFTNSDCAGFGYKPGMMPLNAFFNKRLGGAPAGVNYNFLTFQDGAPWCSFPATCPGSFWSPGRKAFYETIGGTWITNPPPLSGALGDYTIKLKTYDGVHYVSARNGGGSDINAESTSAGYDETFSLVDVNGGLLMSGDEVYLQTMEGQYISADNGGGGDVYAVHSTPVTWERFRIEKTWGTGQIYDGSPVAFRTLNNYYWSAINGGGGQLRAPYLGVVTWEVFTISLTHN